MTSAPAIGFEYRPSRRLRALLYVVALLTLVALISCGLPWWWKAAGFLSAALLVLRGLRLVGDDAVRAAGWDAAGGWSLRLADGSDRHARLRSFRILGEWILLRLAFDGGTAALLLAPDNSDADIRRRLRMRLAVATTDQPGPGPSGPSRAGHL